MGARQRIWIDRPVCSSCCQRHKLLAEGSVVEPGTGHRVPRTFRQGFHKTSGPSEDTVHRPGNRPTGQIRDCNPILIDKRSSSTDQQCVSGAGPRGCVCTADSKGLSWRRPCRIGHRTIGFTDRSEGESICKIVHSQKAAGRDAFECRARVSFTGSWHSHDCVCIDRVGPGGSWCR